MIYLASPFSDQEPKVRQQRFDAVCEVAARLMRNGMKIFSPIAHSYPIAQHGLPLTEWNFWEEMDREHLEHCTHLIVLMLDGWEQSVGVQAEIKMAREMGKPVTFLDPS